eukprot:3001012-Rhodomonas_salina.1
MRACACVRACVTGDVADERVVFACACRSSVLLQHVCQLLVSAGNLLSVPDSQPAHTIIESR